MKLFIKGYLLGEKKKLTTAYEVVGEAGPNRPVNVIIALTLQIIHSNGFGSLYP